MYYIRVNRQLRYKGEKLCRLSKEAGMGMERQAKHLLKK